MTVKNARGRSLRPLVFFCLLACAGPHIKSSVPAPDRNHITRAEIDNSTAQNALMLVQQLRPQWLQVHGVTSLRTQLGVALYVENVRAGAVSRLREYQREEVEELFYLSGPEATRLYGINHPAGAIQLALRHGI